MIDFVIILDRNIQRHPIPGYRLRRLQAVHGHLPGDGNAGGIVQEVIPLVRQADAHQDRLQC